MKTAQSHPRAARLGRPLGNLQQRRTAIETATAPVRTTPVEACLAELLDHLGIARAHFAGRSLADLQGLIAEDPQRIASLTLACPAVLNPRRLAPSKGF
jgi:pimeloyl-ACP methyl ester carboxylesterase